MTKISKREARKRYVHRESFIMVPGNYCPDSWAACPIDGNDSTNEDTFENLCNQFLYYNSFISHRISFYVA